MARAGREGGRACHGEAEKWKSVEHGSSGGGGADEQIPRRGAIPRTCKSPTH